MLLERLILVAVGDVGDLDDAHVGRQHVRGDALRVAAAKLVLDPLELGLVGVAEDLIVAVLKAV